ncbi:MAG: minichromosome maintenance protein MCM [Nanoarchaeota archaeon]|nr:minichromosome maintenance protein MCM [Nanoarchaeota archaeon]
MEEVNNIELFENFFQDFYIDKIQKAVTYGKKSIYIKFSDLSIFNSELANNLLDSPDIILNCALDALSNLKFNLIPRITGLTTNIYKVKELRAKMTDKLVQIKGIIKKTTKVKQETLKTNFECPSCGNTWSIHQKGNLKKEPRLCSCGRKGHFTVTSEEIGDYQNINIEELSEEIETTEQPQQVKCLLKGDLCSSNLDSHKSPGTKVNVVGFYRTEEKSAKNNAKLLRRDSFFDILSIEPIGSLELNENISDEDMLKIREFSSLPFNDLIVNLSISVVPSVYGHDMIKLALLLQQIGGVRRTGVDGTNMRGSLHILLVGDTGTAKSQLGRAIKHLMPKARYVSGKGASGVGITASLVRDDDGSFALEAGAMVLANGSTLIMDEIDKLKEDEASHMNEGMEDQIISISKSGINATLMARTSILAIANPIFSRFDLSKDIPSQINIHPTIISRCDLVLPVFYNYDSNISDFILNNRTYKANEPLKLIPFDILRKYIIFAQSIQPVRSDEINSKLRDFHKKYAQNTNNGQIRMEYRQLEALIRLSEASAKMRLSNIVEECDIKIAFDLIMFMLQQLGIDNHGNIEVDKIFTGHTQKKKGKYFEIMEIMQSLILKSDKGGVSADDLYEVILNSGMKISKFEFGVLLDNLKMKENLIYETKGLLRIL